MSRICVAVVAFFLVVCTGFRLVVSLTLHMWYAWDQMADDRLLMDQSLPGYFESQGRYKLAKNQGYSLWLRFIAGTGINVDVAYFLIWFVAAVLVAVAIWRLFHKRWLSLFAYMYVLWNPLAFDNWIGIRVYRNSLFAPAMFILLALLMLLLAAPLEKMHIARGIRLKHDILRSAAGVAGLIVLGLWFAFVHDLKEDSVWLVPMFLVVIMLKLAITLKNGVKSVSAGVLAVALCLVPAGSAWLGIAGIKHVNKTHFGVSMLNTRTEGAFAGFMQRVYQIRSADQTPVIWTPKNSIDQAFAASPTLRSVNGLQHYVEHSGFAAPDITEHPLKGEFLSWQMIDAIDATIGWHDERRIQSFFSKVNADLDNAFQSGTLRRTAKISLSSSLVPRTLPEIFSLIGPTLRYYGSYFSLNQYRLAVKHNDTKPEHENANFIGLNQLNIDPHNPNPHYFSWFSFEHAQRCAQRLLTIYRCINFGLALAALIAIARLALQLRRRMHAHVLPVILALCLWIYGLAYSFVVAWYVEYLAADADQWAARVHFFNTVGLVQPMIVVGLLLAVGSLKLHRE